MRIRRDKPRELTGRHVWVWLVGFFGSVFAVNACMVHAAISTFGGVETVSSYKAGLQFEQRSRKGASARQALHWQVDGKLTRDKAGRGRARHCRARRATARRLRA